MSKLATLTIDTLVRRASQGNSAAHAEIVRRASQGSAPGAAGARLALKRLEIPSRAPSPIYAPAASTARDTVVCDSINWNAWK